MSYLVFIALNLFNQTLLFERGNNRFARDEPVHSRKHPGVLVQCSVGVQYVYHRQIVA